MELSAKRKQMNGIIKNIENNLDIAIEQFTKTGQTEYQAQIDYYGGELKRLRDEVWDHESGVQGDDIRKKAKILSVGYGFVGSAVGDHLCPHIREHVIIDPALNDNRIADHADANAAIVCLPTPSVNGRCDDSLVKDVVAELLTVNPDMHILLKSTLPPDQLQFYPEQVTYNPEFLRAASAKQDYVNQKFMILGGVDRAWWHRVFMYMNIEFVKTDRTTACMVKYMHNTWLAMKVAYFHEVYQRMGQYYDHAEMIDILAKFENMGPSHMAVTDGLGFGGHCFPKDTEAFYDFTQSEILKKVIEVNEKLIDLQ